MEDFVNDDETPGGATSVEAILDELLPEELEWERLVRTYPVPAVALAAIGGFVIGLRHGPEILTAVSSFLAAEVSRNVSELIG
ncbi:MAG: hypothetical protein QOH06_1901 [Acidobacteriota bacterium]|jgi:hypothetical protein|nr:hypothetical protein [Acidobacteriota bacterium]